METITSALLNNGLAIGIIILIIFAIWKSAPKIGVYCKEFMDKIKDNNTRLTIAFEKLGEDFKEVKTDVQDLKNDVAVMKEEIKDLKEG